MFKSRDLALISAFAALYLVWGYVSSVTIRAVTLSQDLFFMIAALFAILGVLVRQSWSATLLGTITGLIFLGTPAPHPYHITASLIANGLVFDLYLRFMSRRTIPPSKRQIGVAATLGNLAMAVIGLSAFQATGTTFPEYIWAGYVALGALLGGLGAIFGLTVARRVLVSTKASRGIEREETLSTSSTG